MIQKRIRILLVLAAGLMMSCATSEYPSGWSPNVDLGSGAEAVKLELESGCPIVLTPQAILQNPTGLEFVFELSFAGTSNSPGFSATSGWMDQNKQLESLAAPGGELRVADLVEFLQAKQRIWHSSGPGKDYWLNGRGHLVIEQAGGPKRWWVKLAQLVRY